MRDRGEFMSSRSSRRGDKILRSTGRGLGAVVLGASVLAPLTAVNAAPTVSQRRPTGHPVLDWNRFAGEAAVAACIAPMDDPLHESRMYALAHLAMHDALNAIDRRSRPYALWTPAPRGTSADAAVAAAARGVLVRALNGANRPAAVLHRRRRRQRRGALHRDPADDPRWSGQERGAGVGSIGR